jgi:hypothetical protein
MTAGPHQVKMIENKSRRWLVLCQNEGQTPFRHFWRHTQCQSLKFVPLGTTTYTLSHLMGLGTTDFIDMIVLNVS